MDQTTELTGRIAEAAARGTALRIRAGGTKDFYGQRFDGDVLDPRGHHGIVDYEPTELVVTVRSGTPLAALQTVLAERGQVLAFEPPHFGVGATVGGCVAAGLSGPRRAAYGPVSGALRDFVLGCRLIDGRGQVLSFGGTVIKNVAGYDASRLMAGAMGTLGLLLDVSLKVLPRPMVEATLQFAMDEAKALLRLNEWAGQPLPISASAWHAGFVLVRLSGAQAAVRAASERLLREEAAHDAQTIAPIEADAYWRSLREHHEPFFTAGDTPLWRLSLPSSAAPIGELIAADPPTDQVIEWGGAQRWLRSAAAAAAIRARATALGGHATLFRPAAHGDRSEGVFTPLSAPLRAIHQRLKAEFDPAAVLNPGRLYAGL